MDDLEKALYHIRKSEQMNPHSDKTQRFLAQILLEMGDMDSAKKHLHKALQLNPKNERAINDYRRHFGEYNAKSIECDLKSFVLKGHHGGIRKEKQQHYRG